MSKLVVGQSVDWKRTAKGTHNIRHIPTEVLAVSNDGKRVKISATNGWVSRGSLMVPHPLHEAIMAARPHDPQFANDGPNPGAPDFWPID